MSIKTIIWLTGENVCRKKKLKELNEQENIIDKLAPKGSKRRVVVNICTQVYTHPKQILHYMKPQKIKRVFY